MICYGGTNRRCFIKRVEQPLYVSETPTSERSEFWPEDLNDPRHGHHTAATERLCACEKCEAERQRIQARKRARRAEAKEKEEEARRRELAVMEANPADPRHGNIGYQQYGCRCPKCVSAHECWERMTGRVA